MSERSEALRAVRGQTEPYDVVVVGGGITGAGIARDAALRGLRVAVLEKSDLAAGTSSASSKLIHGGLRYLEQFQFGLVWEGTHERAVLMRLAPHLARPLPFVFPIYTTSRVRPFTVRCGMWLYDALAAFRNVKRHRMLSRGGTREAEPELAADGLLGSALYYDCLTDDARLTLETAVDAAEHGAHVVTYAEVTGLERDESGRTCGVTVRADEETFSVAGKVVVVAAGPWTDAVLGSAVRRPVLRPTKGSHVVVDAQRLPVRHALLITAPQDGRVMFAIPWGARTILGTTDTDSQESPDTIEADRADVEYLLAAANHYFPRLGATEADVLSTWSGLRPLMSDPDSVDASAVSREHMILSPDPGVVCIAGGKLTTYRLMAEQVVDKAIRQGGLRAGPKRSASVPLPGAREEGFAVERFAGVLAREEELPADVARHLTESYGVRAREVLALGREHGVGARRLDADLPYVEAEAVWGAAREWVVHAEDFLRRRTQLFLQSRDQGLWAAERVCAILGGVLGWDDARREAEIARYRARVAASRAYRRVDAPASRALQGSGGRA